MSTAIIVHVLTPCKIVGSTETHPEFYHEPTADGRGIWTEWAPANQKFLQSHLENVQNVQKIVWHRVTLENYEQEINKIAQLESQSYAPQGARAVVLSVMDGVEHDGWPGLSVLKYLEQSGLPFTGAGTRFFAADANKNVMKELLQRAKASTPRFVDLQEISDQWKRDGRESDFDRSRWIKSISELQMPVIVKPSPSSGSCGITEASVCHSPEAALNQGLEIIRHFGAAYMEEFITGPEFTCLVTGDAQLGITSYCPVERVFRKNLPSDRQFLSFNMKWAEWGQDEHAGKSWWYDGAPIELRPKIQLAAEQTYQAIQATGYARFDMRMDKNTGVIYVIDVNANCSLDGDEESALGIVLRSQGIKFPVILTDIISYAFKRAATKGTQQSQDGNAKSELATNYVAVSSPIVRSSLLTRVEPAQAPVSSPIEARKNSVVKAHV